MIQSEGINILSLFDGMSCGFLALQRAGIKIKNYYACEIDKHAVKVSTHKNPFIKHLGDVSKVSATQLCKIDLIIGGSPCQGFSNAGKGLNFNDPRSKLFFDYVRLLQECKDENPEIKFLLENVRMKKEWEDIISIILKIQPILINSSLLSAQNRERLYWTNISTANRGLFDDVYCTIPQPKDKGIFLKHILQENVEEKFYLSEKAMARILSNNVETRQTGNYFGCGKSDSMDNRAFYENGKCSNVVASTSTKPKVLLLGVTNQDGTLSLVNKSTCIDANYFKGMDNHSQRTMVVHENTIEFIQKADINGNPKNEQDKAACFTAGGNSGGNHSDMDLIICHNTMPRSGDPTKGGTGHLSRSDGKSYCLDTGNTNAVEYYGTHQQDRIYNIDGKMGSLPAGTHCNAQNFTKIKEQGKRIRRLTPIEVCRLQTVPDNYFLDDNGIQLVSDSQIYKMCGNGWTIDVVAYILSFFGKN